ncbi:hypothetical protein NVP1121O_058 [Vibrio phage 1.121.O._10N.286.46.C4]|nr:hypothetical protein NVP1121O_058 [Vibrio phage 1.121.O._10N.286.46.C4]
MKDFLLDLTTMDLDLSSGLKLTTEKEAYYQTILMGLKLNLGEFFTHVNYGLPWLKNPDLDVGGNLRFFLGNNFPDPDAFINSELDRHLERVPFVDKVMSSSRFDTKTREFNYEVKIQTKSGEILEFTPYLLNL